MKKSAEYIVSDETNNPIHELLSFASDRKVFCFFAEMGAGKTTFIRGLCRHLGVKTNVSSPTFSIVNEYISDKAGIIYHFDFYRIKSEREAVEIGCSEYFDSGNFCFIEWPEKILNLLPDGYVRIDIKDLHGKRHFAFSYE